MTRFDRFVAHLKASQPFRRRLVVRRVAMGLDGNTTLSGSFRTITISIHKNLPFDRARDALVHEWGHAAEMDDWEPHGEVWGKHQALAYRAWEEFWEAGN